ncbi:MAG: hypothetical protein IKR85_06575 [Clostridia bacterium]|nr:hypothetical protein [Clostridia bacterium]
MSKLRFLNVNITPRRVFMSLSGVIIGAVAVGIFKLAALGVDPFQSLMSGLHKLFPISFGMLYMIVNAILLLFSLIFNRHNIGVATFINLFLLGYVTEFSYAVLKRLLPEPSLPVRAGCLALGIVILCFGSALYMTADLGVSTYDSVAITLSEKWRIGRFKYVRISTDLVCVLLGAFIYVLGGGSWKQVPEIVGVGTVITAFFMGPLIEFFNVHVARPMLRGTVSQSTD